MEFYIEEIVERKKTPLQVLTVLGLSLACLAMAGFVFMVLMPMVPMFGSMLFMLLVLMFYLAYQLAVSFNVEFEYSMVNSEIDIDKIVNQRKRKRLTTVDVKKLEAFGMVNESSEFAKFASDISIKKIYAARERKASDSYFAVYTDNGIRTLLVFNPGDKIIDMIEKLKPKKY